MKAVDIPLGVIAVMLIVAEDAGATEAMTSLSILEKDTLRFHTTLSGASFRLRLDLPQSVEPLLMQLRDIRGALSDKLSYHFVRSRSSLSGIARQRSHESDEKSNVDFRWKLVLPFLNVVDCLKVRQLSRGHRDLIEGETAEEIIDNYIRSIGGDFDTLAVSLTEAHRELLWKHRLKREYNVQMTRSSDGVCRFAGLGNAVSFAGHTTMPKFRLPCPDGLQIICDRPCGQKLVRI